MQRITKRLTRLALVGTFCVGCRYVFPKTITLTDFRKDDPCPDSHYYEPGIMRNIDYGLFNRVSFVEKYPDKSIPPRKFVKYSLRDVRIVHNQVKYNPQTGKPNGYYSCVI